MVVRLLISVKGWADARAIMRSEGLRQWKIPMTPAGIEPATFRFTVQHLNHCATAVPLWCNNDWDKCTWLITWNVIRSLQNEENFLRTWATGDGIIATAVVNLLQKLHSEFWLLGLGSICCRHVLSNVYFRLNFNPYKFMKDPKKCIKLIRGQGGHSYCYVQLDGSSRFVINIDSKQMTSKKHKETKI